MKLATAALSAAALGFALAAGAYADTRTSKDKATMEKNADASSPRLDEERAESSQGQPNTIGGATVRDSAKDARKAGKRPDNKTSSSAGSSTPASAADKEQAFKRLDIDGDGSISKAEAAGNAKLMEAFDGADKNRDGKLSRAEYDDVGKPEAKAKAKTSQKAKAQAK